MKDRGTYKLEFSPRLDGKPCPYVVVEGPLAKRVAGLSLISRDIRDVQEILSRLDPHQHDSVGNRALMFGALALYGKCFTQAKDRRITLAAKDIFGTAEARSSHDRLMHLRHEYVAHGGNTKQEQLQIILLLDPDKSKDNDARKTRRRKMLQLRPNCECCNKDLPPESTEARICSFECTFCSSCAENVLGGKCPNCGGELENRPRRPANKLAKYPASTERLYKPAGCNNAA